MMSKDGGPAFPRQTFDYYPALNKTHAGPCDPGISKLDYFAAAALTGDMASQSENSGIWANDARDADIAKRCALVFRIAAAMLAESERRTK